MHLLSIIICCRFIKYLYILSYLIIRKSTMIFISFFKVNFKLFISIIYLMINEKSQIERNMGRVLG